MIIKLQHQLSFIKKLQPITQYNTLRHLHKTKWSMTENNKTAFFHLLEDNEKFKVSFCYVNESVGVNRQFNFERRTIETVQCFLSRVTANLEKIVANKVKKKRKKCDDNGEKVTVSVELLSNDNEIVPESAICKDVFFPNTSTGSLKLRMMGLDYVVSINSPWVDSISLPSSIMVGFPVYASTFEAKFADRLLSSFFWKKLITSSGDSSPARQNKESKASTVKGSWADLGEGYVYVPTVTDVGCQLKVECTPKNAEASGPVVECESVSVVEAGPGFCPFENRHMYTNLKTPKGNFRVVSYNILADVYSSTDTAQNELFSYCPPYALNIDYRKQLFLKELLGYNADLVCLQEVDLKVFQSDLTPVLAVQGLVGVHAKKSTISEGVASFYSSDKFKLLDVKEVVLSEELLNKSYCSHILEAVEKNPQLKERISGLGSAALALILESTDNPEEILVCGNTHLYFHPDADHIRLLQAGLLVAFLTNIVNQLKTQNAGKRVSVVCCGDFNSVPQCGIYKLMTTKTVPSDFVDWKSKPEEEVKDLSLSQVFDMRSACGTPKYTNFTVGFADCLDYIFYQADAFKVESRSSSIPSPQSPRHRQDKLTSSFRQTQSHVGVQGQRSSNIPSPQSPCHRQDKLTSSFRQTRLHAGVQGLTQLISAHKMR